MPHFCCPREEAAIRICGKGGIVSSDPQGRKKNEARTSKYQKRAGHATADDSHVQGDWPTFAPPNRTRISKAGVAGINVEVKAPLSANDGQLPFARGTRRRGHCADHEALGTARIVNRRARAAPGHPSHSLTRWVQAQFDVLYGEPEARRR